MLSDRKVAVKRLPVHAWPRADHEIKILQKIDGSNDIIRYFAQVKTPEFIFVAIELCHKSLFDLIHSPVPPNAPLHWNGERLVVNDKLSLGARELLLPIMRALVALHERSMVHRDVKPHNILVDVNGKVVLSDFGLSRTLRQGEAAHKTTARAGSFAWRAPEVAAAVGDVKVSVSLASDIFSMGCVIHYVATNGVHAFGEAAMMGIIEERNRVRDGAAESAAYRRTADVVRRMTAWQPGGRINAAEALEHPFFWTDKGRLDFLVEASAFLNSKPETVASKLAFDEVDKRNRAIVGDDWSQKIHPLLWENLRGPKGRGYNIKSTSQLVAAIRNKSAHYHELPEEIVALFTPHGLLYYFEERFPLLFMQVYNVMLTCAPTDVSTRLLNAGLGLPNQ